MTVRRPTEAGSHAVRRIRRPWTIRRMVRGILFVAGVAAGDAIAWFATPHGDTALLDLNMVRGTLFGGVLGLVLMQVARDGPRPRTSPPDGGTSLDRLRQQFDLDDSTGG